MSDLLESAGSRGMLELDPIQIAEAIWMAQFVLPARAAPQPEPMHEARRVMLADPSPATPILPTPVRPMHAPTTEPRAHVPPQTGAVPIYAPVELRVGEETLQAVHVPLQRNTLIDDPIALRRALRVLARRVPSRHDVRIDDEATARRLAEERIFVPVTRPAQRRWLRLHLLIDQSRSMEFWRSTVDELRQVIQQTRIFRDLRYWALDTKSTTGQPLIASLPSSRPVGAWQAPQSLIDRSGQTVILIVSDCVSAAWSANRYGEAIHEWATHGPVAILHLLPERLRRRTGIGRAVRVALNTSEPAMPNVRLRRKVAAPRRAERIFRISTPVPVLTLQAESVSVWAQFVAGRGEVKVDGVLIEVSQRGAALSSVGGDRQSGEPIGEQRVHRFLAQSSELGIQLARLLAAAPAISPSLARIAQRELLPRSDMSHFAEVFLGGLLKSIAVSDRHESWYDFIDNARTHLLRLSSHDDTIAAYQLLSTAISQHVARQEATERRFAVVAGVPENVAGSLPVPVQQAFAHASSTILRDLGYIEAAEAIEAHVTGGVAGSTRPRQPVVADSQQGESGGALHRGSARLSVEIGTAISGDRLANDMAITQFFGDQQVQDDERLLRDYLVALLDDNRMLRLSRMTERRQSGAGQELLPPLRLQDVFTSLTTDGPPVIAVQRRRSAAHLHRLVKRLRLDARTAEVSPPEQIRRLWIEGFSPRGAEAWRSVEQYADSVNREMVLAALAVEDPHAQLTLTFHRPELAIEAGVRATRLVLLGAPGSGKSTVLRYLALLLAQRLLDSRQPAPPGWSIAPVPVLCPLGAAAEAVESAPAGREAEALWGALERMVDGGGVRRKLGEHLQPALRRGGALLLLDGLDELPATPGPGGVSPRARMSAAIREVARSLPRVTTVIVTCRTLPYGAAPDNPRDDWRLPPDDGWQTRTIQPLAFGQVRQFVSSWYDAACATPAAIYAPAEGDGRATSLLAQLERSERLRKLIESPLLLTMLAILHYNREAGELPRDRARLYDACVQLLLERWEPVRTPELRRDGLLQRLGIADRAATEDLRAVLHRVALDAHRRPPEPGDGRGVLRGTELEGELLRFFSRLKIDRPDEKLQVFAAVLREDAGLLHELGDDAYAFPHLTFQEFLAACALANDPELVKHAYAVWSGPDGDRWREVLLLMVGRLRQQGKVETQGVPWLQALLRPKTPGGAVKTVEQRRRDALLAADSYQEWEGRAALLSIEPEELERPLVAALLSLLDAEPLAASRDRRSAGAHLGRLGDPRPGVCDLRIDWCEVLAGPFLLGSTDSDGQAWDDEKPQRTVEMPGFRISRYPVTNAQWRLFIEVGGYAERRWWSEAGWQAKEQGGWNQPALWTDARFNGLNQPVVGVSWYEANAFCRWLSAELGYDVRLPSEAEWEKASRGSDGRIFPWGNDWDALLANTSESSLDAPSAVGCYPNGGSPCGALDMSGNVFEWTATPWTSNHQQSDGTTRETEDGAGFVRRGGSWAYSRRNARCASRYTSRPSDRYNYLGLRVVAALTLGRA